MKHTFLPLFENGDDWLLIEAIGSTLEWQVDQQDNLSPLQRIPLLVWGTAGLAENGGLSGFWSRGLDPMDETIEALETVRSHDGATLLRDTLAVLPPGGSFDNLPGPVRDVLESRSHLLRSTAVIGPLADWIRAHRSEFVWRTPEPVLFPDGFDDPPRTPFRWASGRRVAAWLAALRAKIEFAEVRDAGGTRTSFGGFKGESAPPPQARTPAAIDLSWARHDNDATLAWLGAWRGSRHVDTLRLCECRVTEAGLRALPRFSNLRFLDLRATRVFCPDRAEGPWSAGAAIPMGVIEVLKSLPALETLLVERARVAPADANSLLKARPRFRIDDVALQH